MTIPRLRVLFVFACLDHGHAEAVVALLGDNLNPDDFRIDVVACFSRTGASDDARTRLEASGIDVDRAPYNLSFEQTVEYLAHKLPAYDIVVSCQNVADVYPALERLHWRPPLIEYGERISQALAGPKHFTSRYVATSPAVRSAAATRMPGRTHHAIEISSAKAGSVARAWQALFLEVLAERRAARAPSFFASFIQGGFECSTHRRLDGRRLDLLKATAHDEHALLDYRQLHRHGMATVRDGVRWHLIERSAARYDWSSFLPMLHAARQAGTEVIWDLMHYGWPDHLDIWSPDFVSHFARFAANTARLVKSETDDIPFYCPINEISYLAWGGGDAAYLNPFAEGRSFELKVQLARAAIAAMQEILGVDPRARFVHCEPVINIVADAPGSDDRLDAEHARQAQFQAFDMIEGTLCPELGGEPRLLDIVGVNYYRQNQWVLGGTAIDPLDPRYRPFRSLLAEVYARYGRPVLVAETGTEGDQRAAWLQTIALDVIAARKAGIPVEGICLYPIIDHVGWDNDRACPSGLLATRFESGGRTVHRPLAAVIARLHREGFPGKRPPPPILTNGPVREERPRA